MEGPQPLTLAEMYTYLEMFGVPDQTLRRRYVTLIQDLDQVFLGHVAEDMARRRSQSQK